MALNMQQGSGIKKFWSFIERWVHSLETEHTFFVKEVDGIFVTLLVYVDAILIAINKETYVQELKTTLAQAFKLTDLGKVKLGISVCQRKYDLDMLEKC